jgi:hypothetical protein
MSLKRKITTVEEYAYSTPRPPPAHRASPPGVAERCARWLFGCPWQGDFYPLPQKRRYYADGKTLLSLALADGFLNAGCRNLDCARRCAPIHNFAPSVEPEKDAFTCALQAHDNAVDANDLQVASEQRLIVELLRDELCTVCRAPAPEAEAEADDDASSTGLPHQ